jgi:hypothetical protein
MLLSVRMGTPEEEIIAKLRQIEEQARAALADFPQATAKDRLRLILGLAGHLALKLEIERTAERFPPNDALLTRARRTQ